MDDQKQQTIEENRKEGMQKAPSDEIFDLPPVIYQPDDGDNQLTMEMYRTPSIKNKQYEMTELLTMIMNEIDDISLKTAMGRDWSMILYYACGWNKVWQKLFLSTDPKTGESTYQHKAKIHYTDKFVETQGLVGKGECEVCAQSDTDILRNICGHEYCFTCWEGHMSSRLREYYREPLPPCMNGDCPIKMSYTLCNLVSDKNQQLKAKFVEVLCRSYANLSTSVKMCKGKQGTSCQKCFTNEVSYDFIQCNTCGSFVCPRCGEQNHGSTQCFELRNWRELSENSQDFIQHFGIKICPTCKEGVYKYTGCNYIKCKCSEQFCYVCEIKWYPIHLDHFNCPRQKQVDKLNEEKKKIKQNSEAYFQKMQGTIDNLNAITRQIQRITKLKKNNQFMDIMLKNFNFVKSKLQSFLSIGTALQKALCVLWGHTLSLHFESENFKELNCKILKMKISTIYDFIFNDVEAMYVALSKTNPNELSKKQLEMITQQGKNKFYNEFFDKQKQAKDTLTDVKKICQKLEDRQIKFNL